MTTDTDLRTETARLIRDSKDPREMGRVVAGLLDRIERLEAALATPPRDPTANPDNTEADHE